jgi:LmbE family N-acetylglucosaminyl deacetylase
LYQLGLPTTTLQEQPMRSLVEMVMEVLADSRPELLYLPFRFDAHSDHAVTFDCCAAAAKSFRSESVKCIRCYETLSETNYALFPDSGVFSPSTYMDITPYFERKVELLSVYDTELKPHPFPRSIEAVRAQALLRGSEANIGFAEAFMTIKEVL